MGQKVLGTEISKNYYHIRNQHPRIHTSAKFRLRQSIFKFWDQIRYFWDKNEIGERTSCVLFWVMTLYSIDNWVIVRRSVNILGHSDS